MIGLWVIAAFIQLFNLDSEEVGLEERILYLAHLIPLATCLLAIKWHFGAEQTAEEASNSFAPKPVNVDVEKLGWNDIIINDSLKSELQSVVELLRDSRSAKKYGINIPKGILLSGPPGTGKTMIAKVLANEAGLSFFAFQQDQIISQWVGESEKNLSALFESALQHAPSAIFIDEVDSIGAKRSAGGERWAENLLNHLLQLMDGVIKREGIYIIAATNRPDMVDDALMRSGRLNRVIDVGLPDSEARQKLFNIYLKNLPLAERVDVKQFVARTNSCSGADIKEICNRAGLHAFTRESKNRQRQHQILIDDIEVALSDVLGTRYASKSSN